MNAPTINAPDDIQVACGDSVTPENTGTAVGAHECGVTIEFSDVHTHTCAPDSNAGYITRTWTATNPCMDSASDDQVRENCFVSVAALTDFLQIITIADMTGPVVTIPPDATVECGQGFDTTITGQASAVDDCGGAVTISHLDAGSAGVCGSEQSIARTFTATDACGNKSMLTQVCLKVGALE